MGRNPLSEPQRSRGRRGERVPNGLKKEQDRVTGKRHPLDDGTSRGWPPTTCRWPSAGQAAQGGLAARAATSSTRRRLPGPGRGGAVVRPVAERQVRDLRPLPDPGGTARRPARPDPAGWQADLENAPAFISPQLRPPRSTAASSTAVPDRPVEDGDRADRRRRELAHEAPHHARRGLPRDLRPRPDPDEAAASLGCSKSRLSYLHKESIELLNDSDRWKNRTARAQGASRPRRSTRCTAIARSTPSGAERGLDRCNNPDVRRSHRNRRSNRHARPETQRRPVGRDHAQVGRHDPDPGLQHPHPVPGPARPGLRRRGPPLRDRRGPSVIVAGRSRRRRPPRRCCHIRVGTDRPGDPDSARARSDSDPEPRSVVSSTAGLPGSGRPLAVGGGPARSSKNWAIGSTT